MIFDLFNVLGFVGLIAGVWCLILNLCEIRARQAPELRKSVMRASMVGVVLAVGAVLVRYPYGIAVPQWIVGFPFPAVTLDHPYQRKAGLTYPTLVADALVGFLLPQLALRVWSRRSWLRNSGTSATRTRSRVDYLAIVGTFIVFAAYAPLVQTFVKLIWSVDHGTYHEVELSHDRLVAILPLSAVFGTCALGIAWILGRGATRVVRVIWYVALVTAVLTWPTVAFLTLFGGVGPW